MADLARRNFLRGRLSGRCLELRPPWALPEEAFLASCSRCGDCVRACPESILEKGSGGYPFVDFAKGTCTFCGTCVESCRTGALKQQTEDAEPWTIKAGIESNCLALQRTVCRSCSEACDARAIVWEVRPGLGMGPRVLADRCTGCGGCVRICPVQAVRMAVPQTQITELNA